MEREQIKHPSFGQISFSRVSHNGKGVKFYGSELAQDNYIQMTLHRSELIRDLTKEWYYETGERLIKVRMSSGQFSELLTSIGQGSGVPCTIEMINGENIEPLMDVESRKEFVHRKFQERMTMFAKGVKENRLKAKAIIQKKKLSAQDMHDLTRHIDWLSQEVQSNIPFFTECFQETMDQVVFEAKLEVENAIQHKINVLGMAELHKQKELGDRPKKKIKKPKI